MFRYRKPDNPARYRNMKDHFDSEMRKSKVQKQIRIQQQNERHRKEQIRHQKRTIKTYEKKAPLSITEIVVFVMVVFSIGCYILQRI